jgi:hypothetical protein
MRQTDLELYRWKFHNDIYMKYKRVQEAKSQMPLFSYWKQEAAFISVLPRQSGKTHMLSDIIMEFDCRKEDYIIFVPSDSIRMVISNNFRIKRNQIIIATNDVSRIFTIVPSKTHMLVDEFDLIERTTLNNILNYDWRSVTMVSTLR